MPASHSPPMKQAPPEDLSAMRRRIRAERSILSAHDQTRAAQLLAQQLRQSSKLKYKKHIGIYLAGDGEVDPALFAQQRRGQMRFYLPIIQPDKSLLFGEQGKTALKKNRFGILEPRFSRQLKSAQQLDAILVPLVAFDGRGNRIGMGGGFYDRTLAFKNTSGRYHQLKPVLIGLAHRLQQVDHIEPEEWDVMLDQIISV